MIGVALYYHEYQLGQEGNIEDCCPVSEECMWEEGKKLS